MKNDPNANQSGLSKRISQEANKAMSAKKQVVETRSVSSTASEIHPPAVEDITMWNDPVVALNAASNNMSELEQVRHLNAIGHREEARQAVRRLLYKDSTNVEAWWLYAQIAENEDQLYHILDAIVSLPPNQYTARARAKLTQMAYRAPLKEGILPNRTTDLYKRVTQPMSMPASLKTGEWAKPRATPKLNFNNKAIIGIAVAGIVVTIVLSGLFAMNAASSSPLTALIPTVSAGNLINYLLDVKLPISNLNSLVVPSSEWAAKQGIQFDVRQGADKGTFVVLSYDSLDVLAGDAFKARSVSKYKTWQISELTNLIVLASPDTSPTILKAVSSHLSHYIVAPYRSYVPTATPAQ